MDFRIKFRWLLKTTLIPICFFGFVSNELGAEWVELIKNSSPLGVASTYFWSGIEFDNRLFGGTHNNFQIWSYPPKSLEKNLPSGETVFSFSVHKGKLYCSNESRQVLRFDGSNNWTITLDATSGNISGTTIACFFGLVSFRGSLYLKAFDWGEGAVRQSFYLFKLQDDGTWTLVYSTNRSELTTFIYKGELYSAGKDAPIDNIRGIDYDARAVVTRLTSNGIFNPEAVPALRTSNYSYYTFGYNDPGSGYLILGLGSPKSLRYAAGTRAEIYLYDGDSPPRKVLTDTNLYKFTDALRVGKKLYVLGDMGYEAEAARGKSRLYETTDLVHWTLTKEFDFPCATALVNFHGVPVVFGGNGDVHGGGYSIIVASSQVR
jgi:hypothetical protein